MDDGKDESMVEKRGREVEAMCLEISCYTPQERSDAWEELATDHGGGDVDNVSYNVRECLIKAVETNSNNATAWFKLGTLKKKTRALDVDKRYTCRSCLRNAVILKPSWSMAWYKLGVIGGENVLGVHYDKAHCHLQAARYSIQETSRRYDTAWSEPERMFIKNALKFNKSQKERNDILQLCSSNKHSSIRIRFCIMEILKLDFNHPGAWAYIAMLLKGTNDNFTFDNKDYTASECLDKSVGGYEGLFLTQGHDVSAEIPSPTNTFEFVLWLGGYCSIIGSEV